jgi:lauroyl/myristoyl acyltransferase
MTIRRATRGLDKRPLATWQDLQVAIELPILWILALVMPERSWCSVCLWLERFKAWLRLFDLRRVADTAARAMAAARPSFDGLIFAIQTAAGRSENHMQILRSRSPFGWKAKPQLVGRVNLDAALAEGHGAVLWVAHFCFNSLAAKKALSQAGYRVWHLSRPEHGFSKSKLGIALFNWIRIGAELRYLAGRIVIERDKPASATLAAHRVLKKNGVISITAGAWEGQRLAEIELLTGKFELAIGAPGLAWLAGSQLLPIFTVRGSSANPIQVVIEKPLRLPPGITMEDAVQLATNQFGKLLEEYISRYPAEWRDWKNLRLS